MSIQEIRKINLVFLYLRYSCWRFSFHFEIRFFRFFLKILRSVKKYFLWFEGLADIIPIMQNWKNLKKLVLNNKCFTKQLLLGLRDSPRIHHIFCLKARSHNRDDNTVHIYKIYFFENWFALLEPPCFCLDPIFSACKIYIWNISE